MNLVRYFVFVVISCSIMSYDVYGDAPIMSKKYIGDKDSFIMTCNASSFIDLMTYNYYNITSLKMYRKVEAKDNNELLGMIEALNPKKSDPIKREIPAGRFWEYAYGKLYGPSMYITLIVKDASKADVGLYWCEADIYGTETKFNSTQFNLRPQGEKRVPLINKNEIGNNDSFTMRCDATSFREINLPKTNYFTRLMIYRQLEGGVEDFLGMLDSFLPPGNDEHLFTKIPEGRKWKFGFGGFKGFVNRDTIFINLTVMDASCKDAGNYWCALHAPRTTKCFCSPRFQLDPKVSNVVKMNAIKVTPTESASFNRSYNFVDDYITMECTFTGWNPMITSWSYKTLYNQHNYNAKLFEAEPFIDVDGCPAYTHRSTKTAVLHRMIGDYIYFCRALNERGADTRVFASMQFILLEKESALSKSQATHFEMSSALLLVWCVCWRFYTIVYCDSLSQLTHGRDKSLDAFWHITLSFLFH